MKIHGLSVLLITATLFTACNKEPENDVDNQSGTGADCRPFKVYLYGFTGSVPFIDTLVYTYSDANVTNITGPKYYFTYEYAGGHIIKRNYFDSLSATTSTDYDTVSYNSDGTVSKIQSYSYDDVNDWKYEDRYEFTYNADKLVKLTYTDYWNDEPSGDKDTHFYTYTGNNITRDSVVEDRSTWSDVSVYHYTYDDQKNHFNKSGANALFHSAIAMDLDGVMLPFFFSSNNVTGAREGDDVEEMKFSYTTDTKGNVQQMKVDGITGAVWEYQCP